MKTSTCSKIHMMEAAEILLATFFTSSRRNFLILNSKTIEEFEKVRVSLAALKSKRLDLFEKMFLSEEYLYKLYDHKKFHKLIPFPNLLRLAATLFGNYFSDTAHQIRLYSRWKRAMPRYGAVVFNYSCSKILLCRAHYNSKFGFPAGKAVPSLCETPLQTAAREVSEEIGIEIKSDDLNRDYKMEVNNFHTRHTYFPLRVDEKMKIKIQKTEIYQAMWVPIESIHEDGLFVILEKVLHGKSLEYKNRFCR